MRMRLQHTAYANVMRISSDARVGSEICSEIPSFFFFLGSVQALLRLGYDPIKALLSGRRVAAAA